MLTDPRCAICGSVMTPEPEGDNPTESGQPTNQSQPDPTDLPIDLAPTDQPLADPTTNQPTEPSTNEGDRYIDTEAGLTSGGRKLQVKATNLLSLTLKLANERPLLSRTYPRKKQSVPVAVTAKSLP